MNSPQLSYAFADRLERPDREELLTFCQAIFPGFQSPYLMDRLPHIRGTALHTARRGEQLVGFKLAYRRGSALLYSWLGGVREDARGSGVARELMMRQHAWAEEAGFTAIETRTRATNTPMIILNLRSGFIVTGYETDSAGFAVVTQRKAIGR